MISVDPKSGLVSVSLGSRDDIARNQNLTTYRSVEHGFVQVGTLTIEKVGDTLSHGQIRNARMTPKAGDLVAPVRFLSPAEESAVLEYIFSFRAVTEEDRDRVHELLTKLDTDPSAARELAGMGGPAAVALDQLKRGGLDSNLLNAGARALYIGAPIGRLVGDAGLEHDVQFLARLDDPRAHARLARILSAVEPFAKNAPKPGPDLAGRIHAWWVGAERRVRWSPEADRYKVR